MTVLSVTEDTLHPLLARRAPVVLFFSAAWSTPGRNLDPLYTAAALQHTDMVFAHIDTDKEAALTKDFGVRLVPTLMVIREKILVYRESGAFSAEDLARIIEHARLIDMDDLRNELAAWSGDMDAIDHCS